MAGNVGSLTADLIARTKKFEAGMARGRKGVRGIGTSAKKTKGQVAALSAGLKRMAGAMVLAAGLGGIGAMIRSSIEFGSAQSDVAAQLKINTVAFQVYTGAIKDAGGTMESMKKSILGMQNAIVQGSEGLTTYERAFERLGINVQSLRGQKVEEQFERIALAVGKAKDQQAALTAVSEIFGKRNAPQLIEVMERLTRDGFGKMAEEIRKTYGIMDAETQKRLDTAADRIEQFKQRATIKVGELIAGGNDGAALKQLGYELAATAARFGGRIIDALAQSAQMGYAIFGSTADFLADRIATAFSNAFDTIRLKALDLFIDLAAKNPLISAGAFEKLSAQYSKLSRSINDERLKGAKKEQATWNSFFAQRLKGFVKTDVAGALGGFWDDLADKQKQVISTSVAGAASLADGLAITPSTKAEVAAKIAAPAALKTAASSKADEMADFADSVSGFDAAVETFADYGEATKASSEELRKKLSAVNTEGDNLRRQGDFKGASDVLGQRFGLRRQINDARSQERIARIRGDATSGTSGELGLATDQSFQRNSANADSGSVSIIALLTEIRDEFVRA